MYSVLAVFFVLFLAGIVTGNYCLVAPLIALGVAVGLAEGFASKRDEG